MKFFFKEREHNTKLYEKMAVSAITALAGILFANPTDVVKIRLQEQSHNANYMSCMDAYKKIYKTEGLLGFWAGVKPNLSRNMLDTPTEIAIYYHSKEFLLNNKIMKNETPLHFLCGLVFILFSK